MKYQGFPNILNIDSSLFTSIILLSQRDSFIISEGFIHYIRGIHSLYHRDSFIISEGFIHYIRGIHSLNQRDSFIISEGFIHYIRGIHSLYQRDSFIISKLLSCRFMKKRHENVPLSLFRVSVTSI